MENEVELIRDDRGVAVIGSPSAVREFLTSHGLWAESRSLNLDRLQLKLRRAAGAVEAASGIAESSARWLKLTPGAAERLAQSKLIETDTPGVFHAVLGKRGSVEGWLQVEQGARSLLTNPAVLSGVATMLFRFANEQAIDEIDKYLTAIDGKVDDVLRKLDDSHLARLLAARNTLNEATNIRSRQGAVDSETWSTVSPIGTQVGEVQNFALLQIGNVEQEIVRKIDDNSLADVAEIMEKRTAEIQKWLAILAECFKQTYIFNNLKLDRVQEQNPANLDSHRTAFDEERQKRLAELTTTVDDLFDGLDAAVLLANSKQVLRYKDSRAIVKQSEVIGRSVEVLRQHLDVAEEQRTWELDELTRPAKLGSIAIQRVRDNREKAAVGSTALIAINGKALAKQVLGKMPIK